MMNAREVSPETSRALAPRQYLSFMLGSVLYGIDILRVQEIRGYSPITPLPNASDHFKGVLNLRGEVVAVIDLRVRLGLPSAKCTKQSVVVIVRSASRLVGLVVDSVSDVVDISPAEIVREEDLGEAAAGALLIGVGKTKDGLLPLLALEVVIGGALDPTLAELEPVATA